MIILKYKSSQDYKGTWKERGFEPNWNSC